MTFCPKCALKGKTGTLRRQNRHHFKCDVCGWVVVDMVEVNREGKKSGEIKA